MVKINLTRISALMVAFFMMGLSANAQTKVWGVGATTGAADGEFANNFVQATAFVPGVTNPTEWTALTISDKNGTGASSAAYWTRSTLGYSQGAFASKRPFGSPSAANGSAIFDSDFLDNGGDEANIGLGTSPGPQRGELISPRIDLTGYKDSAMIVEFYTLYRNYDAKMLVGLSVDDGLTWEDVNFQEYIGDNIEGSVRILFKNTTAAVANLTECRLRFVFDGNYYFNLVDDVVLESAPKYDIAMSPGSSTDDVYEQADNVKVSGNRHIALSNLDPSDLREWVFGAKVINLGGSDILPNASPKIHMNIDYVDALTGAVDVGVYRDSLDLDTIVAGDLMGNSNSSLMDNIDFIMTRPNGGDYRVTYWASHNNPDGDNRNDTVRHTFTVTTQNAGSTSPNSAYISKARKHANGGVAATTAIFPGGVSFAGWEYGSVYYFPNGARDTISLDSVSFRYHLPRTFTGAEDQTMFCNVYEMDNAGVILSNAALLTQVGFASIPLTGLGTTGTALGDYGRVSVEGFVDAATGTALEPLKDNSFYFISIQTKPSLTGGIPTFTSKDVPWLGADDGINYSMNLIQTRSDSIVSPSPVGIEDATGTISWKGVGFGADVVPSIGLYITKGNKSVSVSTLEDAKGAELNVYPNPASDQLNVEFSLENAADVTYIITDVTGRILDLFQSNNVSKEVQTLDVSKLPSGVYMITAKTEKGASTKRFTVK